LCGCVRTTLLHGETCKFKLSALLILVVRLNSIFSIIESTLGMGDCMRTLLVVTTGNLEHVTAELITESIAGNLIKNPN
jgi:hypothetical protein